MTSRGMTTRRLLKIRQSVEIEALRRAMMDDNVSNIRRRGSEILLLKSPQLGWFDLEHCEDLEQAARHLGVQYGIDDFQDIVQSRADIDVVDKLALLGWQFDTGSSKGLGSHEVGGHYEAATSVSCLDPDGREHFRSDIPVLLRRVDCILCYYDDTKYADGARCDIWVWPDGRWEIDVESVVDSEGNGWRGQTLTVSQKTLERVNLKASQNRDAAQVKRVFDREGVNA